MELLCAVIEDDATLRSIYDFIVKREGYHIVFAKNGQEAMELLMNHVPHLVFLDIRLPMISGLDILKAIRADDRFLHTHIVVVSSQETYRSQVGDIPFLLKPVEPSQLARIARDIRDAYTNAG